MIIEKNRLTNNGKPALRNPRRLTHTQFVALVECLKKHKQKMLDERPSRQDAAEFFGKELGLAVNPGSLADAAKCAGVIWVPRKVGHVGAVKYTVGRLKFLEGAVAKLYEQLGLEAPAELQGE